MLTISKPLSAGQAQTYHQREFTAKEQNYWSQRGVIAGEWQGRMAGQFALAGTVSAEDFAKLSQGQHPQTGEQLVRQRASYEYQDADGKTIRTMERRAGWDATFAVAHSFPERSRARYRGLVYETIFALLYGLGLRVGEVVRLTLADVDFTRDLLLIRESKFQKTRIVPLGPNLARRLKRYVEERHGCHPAPERPLFSFTKRGCIHVGTISQTFHTLLPRLQLHVPPGVSPPRLHDLRHSFAVGTLLRWYRQGIDPNCRLMHLATFLGHVDPNSTAVYLTITEELLNQAARRFQVLAPKGGVE
ncbi:MAG: tyrosine-type recombinase/integrase [Candidatus Sulfotelmatobacter sp.]|jgi:integrase